MIRSFLAIEFPESLKEVIADYLQDLKQVPSKIKWVSPGQSHLTLKFFGSISEELIERISRDLLRVLVDCPPFHLSLKGIGAFPNLFRPRVIWAGLGGRPKPFRKFTGPLNRPWFPWESPKRTGLFIPI